MNTVFLSILFLIVSIGNSYAQELGIGGRVGVNASMLVLEYPDDEDYVEFIGGGQTDVYAYKMFNSFVGIEGGFMLTQEGFRVNLDDELFGGSQHVKSTYFAIPLSARFKFGYFTLNPGIRPSFLIKATNNGDDFTRQVAPIDVGLFASPGIQFPVGLTLNSTINIGLLDVVENFEEFNTNFSFQFSIGYTFFRKDD